MPKFIMPSHKDPKRPAHENTRIASKRQDTASEMTAEQIGAVCKQLDRILDWVEELRNRDDESRTERVARLRADGKIPKTTASHMHTILKADRDRETIRSAWAAVVQWANEQGCLVAQ